MGELCTRKTCANPSGTSYHIPGYTYWFVLAITLLTNALSVSWILSNQDCRPSIWPTTNVSHRLQHISQLVSTSDVDFFMLNGVALTQEMRTSNGRLRDPTSLYRQPPSPSVDHLWQKLAHDGSNLFNVSLKSLRASGRDTDDLISWSDQSDVYPVEFDFTHKIHCLNMLRKEIHPEYYYPLTDVHNATRQSMLRKSHALHCVSVLLQDIQCQPSLNLIPLVWMPADFGAEGLKPVPTGAFNITRQCINTDSIHEWLEQNHVEGATEMLAKLTPGQEDRVFEDDGYWL